MIDRKSDDRHPVCADQKPELKFKRRDLDWYGNAYETLYREKLQMDAQLRDLAMRLQPKKTSVH